MRSLVVIGDVSGGNSFVETLSEKFALSFADMCDTEYSLQKCDAVLINADCGYEKVIVAAAEIKSAEAENPVPVILYTSSDDISYQERLCEADADDIIVLPVCSALIEKRINQAVDLAAAKSMSSRFSNCIKFDKLIDLITEKQRNQGALLVGQSDFISIYRFVMRGLERSEKSVQVVLFTLSCNSEEYENVHDKFMDTLSEAVRQCLRRGDISSVCSRNQVVILLMGADDDGGHLVANRILSNFYSECQDDAYELEYDIREITAE